MKLKVVEDLWREEWIEADTIDTLKASIMVRFSYSADHLSQQRLLVRENRDLMAEMNPTSGCVDLLQLAEGYTLNGGDLCKDGDTLVLGWKGPFTILLDSANYSMYEEIKVNDSFTLGRLKRKIARLMGEPLTEDNLPEVLINGDEGKPLLFFGFYTYSKGLDTPFELYLNKDNVPDYGYPIVRVPTYPTQNRRSDYFGEDPKDLKDLKVSILDDVGNHRLIPCTEFFFTDGVGEYTTEDLKNVEKNKKTTKFQFKENTENQKKNKKKKNKARIIQP